MRRSIAPAQQAAQSTPFGPRIHALAVYLKTTQLFSYQRLRLTLSDLFDLSISEGALMNMFARTIPAFEESRERALTVLRQSRFVSCDDPRNAKRCRVGMRIEGVNASDIPRLLEIPFYICVIV